MLVIHLVPILEMSDVIIGKLEMDTSAPRHGVIRSRPSGPQYVLECFPDLSLRVYRYLLSGPIPKIQVRIYK